MDDDNEYVQEGEEAPQEDDFVQEDEDWVLRNDAEIQLTPDQLEYRHELEQLR